MTASFQVLTTPKGSPYVIRRLLPRPGGGCDLIVSYRRRHDAKATFSAYRCELNGSWQCLSDSWTDLDVAVSRAPEIDRFVPLKSAELQAFLAAAIQTSRDGDLA